MKKRCSAFFLALVLCVGLAVPAFAAVDITDDVEHSTFGQGVYNLTLDTENTADSFVNQDVILDYDLNPPYSGYYTITENTTWTVKNTGSDDMELMIGFNERHKVQNHYSTSRNVCWVLPDGTFSLSLKNAGDTDLSLKSGKSVSFNFKDALAAMEAVANPDNLYEITIGTHGDTGDRYLFKPVGADDSGFTDVPTNAWFAAPVVWAVKKEITNGTTPTTFSPNEDCTHAQILTFLYRVAQGKGHTPSAADMDAAINWAKSRKMVDGNFDPDAKCTRAQAVNYIWRARGSGTVWEKASFTDVPADASYIDAVDWAVYSGVTSGETDTTFAPDKVCTRGHIVTFLYRAYID